MSELQQIGAIKDRAKRLELLKAYVFSHQYDARGWYMLHLDRTHDRDLEGAEVARQRALALDPRVADFFKTAPVHTDSKPPSTGMPRVPGYSNIKARHLGKSSSLYTAVRDKDGSSCVLRVLHGESADSTRRIMERQLTDVPYAGCVPATAVVRADDGTPVQDLPMFEGPPIENRSGRMPGPDEARRAVAALAEILAGPHRDGLIAGDLRPASILGSPFEPGSLAILGVRRPEGETFGTLAGDAGRYRWYAPEEGAARLDARADIYGLGLLLWWLVMGKAPPPLGERLKAPLPSTGDARLDRIVARCTRVKEAERYATVEELRAELLAEEKKSPDGLRAGIWILHERIGGSTVADVYRATHDTDGRRAIVKVYSREQNFQREAAAFSAIKHDGLVRAIEISAFSARPPFIALESAAGESLATSIARGALPVEEAIEIVRQLARALESMHDAGLVHRDVKPDNIFVDRSGGALKVTLIDLDATRFRDRPDLDERELIGTPSHMPPEQWDMLPDVDARSDVYALGIVLFSCLTGKHPLVAESFADWQRVHHDPAARPAPAVAGLNATRRSLLESMIATDRTLRPRSMAEVLVEIDRRPPPNRRALLLGGVVAIATLGTAAAILWWPSEPPESDRGGGDDEIVVIIPDAEPTDRCDPTAMDCGAYPTLGQTAQELQVRAYDLRLLGDFLGTLCLARAAVSGGDALTTGRSYYEMAFAFQQLRCLDRAAESVRRSLLIRPRDERGWETTCDLCAEIGRGGCEPCDL